MSNFDKRVTRKNLFTYKEEGAPFISMKELRALKGDGPYTIRGLWISSSNMVNAHPVVVIEGYNVDFPSYKLQDVEDFLQDPDAIAQINNGECGFEFYDYDNKFGKQTGARWIKL